ncbi:hypothetical protein, conserved [Angomonas deanei]|uniref:Uncharacterized protein n=1 Tax=Angomonas deanei TaxID=59799 RepID=A0A7G2CE23_9TRYP|nr:hypothetical protein, conserved [Angomonas deanei]
MIPLNENQAVAIPANVGPYRLQLPAAPVQAPATPAAVPDATAAATPAAPVAAAVPGTPAATPAAAATATPAIPELETRVTTTSIGSMPAYVVTCKGFYVQLKADNGTNVSGFNTATLQLSNRYAQRVMITITDAGNKTILKQTSYVPATQAPAITLRLTEDANGMTVTGPDRCTFTVGSTKTNGTVGARLTRASTQRVTAEQIHMDGSASSVSLDVGAKPGASMYSGATTAPGSSTVMSQAKPEEQWIAHLAAAVNAPNMDEARRNMQQVRTPNSNASQVVAFINDVLFKQPPTITFTANPTTLSGIQCAGYNISATIGTQQPCLIPTNSQVSVPSNTQATLTAVHAKNGRPVAACRVLLSTSGTGASMTTPNTSVSGPSDMDAKLMARLLEGLQRSGLDPQRAADDFHSVDASPYSYTGQRVLPLLVNTLRRSNLSSAPEKEQFFFTCCNGHLANVYTTHAHYQLSATIDNQAPVSISQRGRVPANGQFTDDQPHFVRLVARDPVTNAVKGDTTVSVMGTGGGDRTNSGTTSSPAGFQSANPYSQYTPSSYPSMQQRETMPSQQSDGYTAPTSVTSQPYMDVSLQQSGPDCIARLTCPSHLRIVCNVDGTGGDTGRSDFAAKVSGDRPHRVEVSLLDSMGKVVFQQKLDIPSMCSSNVWGLALQENGLALDPDAGCSSTVLLDRDPERAVQGGFIGFDATVPHLLVLRKYISGVHGAKTGELLLRLPGSASPKDLLELIRLYRGRAVGQLDDTGLKRELFNLHNRCTAPSVKELISLLTGSTFSPQSAPYNPERGQVATLATTAGGTGDPNRVYFRLTGNC